ncbi:hypothetical protein CJ430_31810, partial [Klebsiella pneumoniae]
MDRALDILTVTPPDVFNHNLENVPRLLSSGTSGRGRMDRALDILTVTPPDVFNHNLENVPRLLSSG